MSNVSPGFVISGGAVLANIIMSLRISPHRYLRMTTSTLEVETENLNPEIVHVLACFFAHVKFGADVEEVTAIVAPNTHR